MTGIEKTIAPYGTWVSPLSASAVTGAARGLETVMADAGTVYVLELRPDEGGRSAIIRIRPDGTKDELLPAGFSARSRVHEYGGGAMCAHLGTVFFVNDRDQRIWRVRPGDEPRAVTPEGPLRFADLIVDERRERLIAVCEDHGPVVNGTAKEPSNRLVSIDLTGTGAIDTLFAGTDFVAHPRLSPDGRRLVFVAWDHPNMPWDATNLCIGTFSSSGRMINVETVMGADAGHSNVQPSWAEDGALWFSSDASGFWNLWRRNGAALEIVAPVEAEIGGPAWNFGRSQYVVTSRNEVIAVLTRNAVDQLARLDVETGIWHPVLTPFTSIHALRRSGQRIVFAAASPQAEYAAYSIDLATLTFDLLHEPSPPRVPPDYVSTPRAITFESRAPDGTAREAHAFFYPPQNPEFRAPENEKPPVIVTAHGGPTASTQPIFMLWRHFWTTRGFAILDVNYSGSTGYGTAYRKRLNGQWGVADVEDVVAAARHAGATGLVDPARIAVLGGSAGGFVVLAGLAFHDVFKAGVSLFGVSDLKLLAAESHKFEARYCDILVGPLPQAAAIYEARSPLSRIDGIKEPLLILQGLDDKVVPPNQSELVFDGVKKAGTPVAYLAFEGEGHGFRRAATRERTLTAELFFLGRVFAINPADNLEPVTIENDGRLGG